MLIVRYIDRETGVATHPILILDCATLSGIQAYCDTYGWDVEIVSYQPGVTDLHG